MSQQELREQLIRQVQAAFSDVKFKGASWHQDPSWQLQGKHWREIPLEMLKRDGFIFGLPVSENGLFFLPAYMVAILTNPEEMEAYDLSLLMIFAPSINVHTEKSDNSPFIALDKKQKLAIFAFLEAYPELFPHLFDIKTFPSEVNESLSELISNSGLDTTLPITPYETWEKAVSFWRDEIARS